jgi:hypothetical protein
VRKFLDRLMRLLGRRSEVKRPDWEEIHARAKAMASDLVGYGLAQPETERLVARILGYHLSGRPAARTVRSGSWCIDCRRWHVAGVECRCARQPGTDRPREPDTPWIPEVMAWRHR